jgi:uncharacterized damage-inducible protein DinB
MNKKFFLELADYNIWANNNAISWLNQIGDEQWKQVVTSSFSSLQQTVMHVASAEKVWVDFWNRVPDPVFLSTGFKGTKNELIDIWKQSSAGLKNFIEKYPEENLTQPITFKWPGGGEGQMEFSQTFSHIINHSTYHRGQLVTILRQLGFTNLSSTDLATYCRVANKIN